VWLRPSLAAVLLVAVLAGCRDSKTYGADEVADALRNHGFTVGVSDPDPKLTNVFAGAPQGTVPDGLRKTVSQITFLASRRPSGIYGPGDLIVEAMIFDEARQASCAETNVIGTCLRKENVAIIVRNDRAAAARKALADLD